MKVSSTYISHIVTFRVTILKATSLKYSKCSTSLVTMENPQLNFFPVGICQTLVRRMLSVQNVNIFIVFFYQNESSPREGSDSISITRRNSSEQTHHIQAYYLIAMDGSPSIDSTKCSEFLTYEDVSVGDLTISTRKLLSG